MPKNPITKTTLFLVTKMTRGNPKVVFVSLKLKDAVFVCVKLHHRGTTHAIYEVQSVRLLANLNEGGVVLCASMDDDDRMVDKEAARALSRPLTTKMPTFSQQQRKHKAMTDTLPIIPMEELFNETT